jgi:hypothetical protein
MVVAVNCSEWINVVEKNIESIELQYQLEFRVCKSFNIS